MLSMIIMGIIKFFFLVLIVSAVIGVIKFAAKLFLGLAVGLIRFAFWALLIGGALWVVNLVIPLF